MRSNSNKGDVLISKREFWAVPILFAVSVPFILWAHSAGDNALMAKVLGFVLLSVSVTVAFRPFIAQCYPLGREDGKIVVHREVVVLFIIIVAMYVGMMLSVFEWLFDVGLDELLLKQ